MPQLRWERRPQLHRPVVVVAFEGWNDAGDAASLAVGYLAELWEAKRFASIDPEELYDFTTTRPQVKLIDGTTRSLEWPEIELLSARIPGGDRDVIFVRGVEPQLRWRTVCRSILEAVTAYDAEMTIILGALLADVAHTRPVPVTGSSDGALALRLGLAGSNYEGPTGIIGVLHHSFVEAGVPSASFWAAVPHYVHQVPSPKAATALLDRVADLVGVKLDPVELRVASEEYVRQVSDRVADDEDAAAYVAQLEEAADEDATTPPLPVDPERLTDEVERFLRQHPGEP